MSILYHASPVKGIAVLEPRISNHGEARVYFSSKKENVLVYLSNAVEKYCREQGFEYNGIWQKWAAYGFTDEGLLRVEEYYPNATCDTYSGVDGCIYTVELSDDIKPLDGIRDAYYSSVPVRTLSCEYIPDAYQAILNAEKDGLITLQRYEDLSKRYLEWIDRTIRKEYSEIADHPEYKFFLEGKFDFLNK